MVVNEHPRGDVAGGEGREHVIPQDGELGGGVHGHAGVIARHVQRFILQRHVMNGNPDRLVSLDIFDEVIREHGIHRRQQFAADHGIGGLHPARRAPGVGHDGQIGVEHKRLLEERDDIDGVMGDGEGSQARIRRPGGQVVVGIMPTRQVGGAHGIAQEADPDAAADAAEQAGHRPSICW